MHIKTIQTYPSQHVQLGHRWGPDGLSLEPQVGSPLGAQLTLTTVFKWVPSGLPIWASPSGAQLGPTEIFILACIQLGRLLIRAAHLGPS